jgi:4-hydroxy-3-polyprenylbenzoate decarboxylase
MNRLIVGISGASGVLYGVRFLKIVSELPLEIHLVISDAAKKNLEIETAFSATDLAAMVHRVYEQGDMGAAISSGSFLTLGMVVIPCSIKTLSGVAHSFNDTLLIRAADVCLKERRKTVLVVRETPLHLGHLKLMARATEMGAIIFPPVPAFYHKPEKIEDIIDHSIGKILDQFSIEHHLFKRWGEKKI